MNLYSSMHPNDSAPIIEGEADNESPENEDVVDVDQLFLEDPILRKHADQATLLNAILRASKRALAMRKFDDSMKLTGDALGLLDKQRASRLDRHWRIGAELLHVAGQKGAGKITPAESLERLDELVKEYEGKDFESFLMLLKRRVALAREINKKKYVASLEYLRKYAKDKFQAKDDEAKQTSLNRLWYVDEYLDSTELLIWHFMEAKDQKKVVALFREAKKDLKFFREPFHKWLDRFPKEIVDKAFPPKSVLAPGNQAAPPRFVPGSGDKVAPSKTVPGSGDKK